MRRTGQKVSKRMKRNSPQGYEIQVHEVDGYIIVNSIFRSMYKIEFDVQMQKFGNTKVIQPEIR